MYFLLFFQLDAHPCTQEWKNNKKYYLENLLLVSGSLRTIYYFLGCNKRRRKKKISLFTKRIDQLIFRFLFPGISDFP
jgi:hypothetical protein